MNTDAFESIWKKPVSLPLIALSLRRYKEAWQHQENQGNLSWNVAAWIVLFITNLIDLLVTYYAFTRGAVEGNPFMAMICRQFGYVGLAAYKGFFMGMLLVLIPFITRRIQWLLWVTVLSYGVLTLSHGIRFF
jgi:hypothetical protein